MTRSIARPLVAVAWALGALLASPSAATGQELAGSQAIPPAAERRLAERQRGLGGRDDLSGLGARGPERVTVAAQQLDPVAERALALALHAGTPALVAKGRAAASRAALASGTAPLPVRGFTPPSIGYGVIAVLALGGLLVGARRHRTRVIVASAFDRLTASESVRAPR